MNVSANRDGSSAPGVGWLDDVPTDWTVTPLKRIASVQSGLTLGKVVELADAIELPYLRVANVQAGSLDLSEVKTVAVSRAEAMRHRLQPGDVLMTEGGDIDKLGRGCLWNNEIAPCLHQNHIFAVRCSQKLANKFLVYILDSPPARDYFYTTAKQTTNLASTNSTTLGNFSFALPPVSVQWAIVKHLDSQCAEIDALIDKQRQLVAALREDRHAQLVNLVAHGCNSDPALKSTRLGWIDAVPLHWDVINIRRVTLMKTGHTPSRNVAEYWMDTTIPWFTLADVWQLRDGTRTYLGETNARISELGLANSAADLLPAGTVVLSRTASVGFTGIMPTPMATSQDFWNWVCGPRLLPEYLMYTFRAMQGYFSALMMGSTHKTIYQADAAAIRIPLPPLSEQEGIVAQIRAKTTVIDVLIAKAAQVIETLLEYRSALITDAVTGKIDVRKAA